MNRTTRLALAATASALCCVTAQAGPVQGYGTIDLGVEHFDNGAGARNVLGNGVLNASVLGLRGSENLGGGTQAYFHLETSFCANGVAPGATSAAQQFCGPGFFGRTSVVGLRGGWGTLKAGRMFTLSNNDFYVLDPLHSDSISPFGSNNVAGIGEEVWASQALEYRSPQWRGWSVAGMYQFGGGQGLQRTTGSYNLHAGYRRGPLYAAADYEVQDAQSGAATVRHSMLLLRYDFGVAAVAAYVARNRPDASTGYPRLDAYALTASVPRGAWTLIGEIAVQRNRSQPLPQTRQYNLGAIYALSRDTSLYAMLAHTSNYNTFANIIDAFGNNSAPTLEGNTGAASNALALGMETNF